MQPLSKTEATGEYVRDRDSHHVQLWDEAEPAAEPTPSRSLVNRTFDRLMEIVLATTVGQAIPSQDQLALQFNVSRTVLREALSKLEYLDVITVRPKTGSKVNPPLQWKVINDDVLRWRTRAGDRHGVPLNRARMESAAPRMFDLLQELVDIEGPQPGTVAWADKVHALLNFVKGV